MSDWDRLPDLFERAIELDEDQLARFIEAQCNDDEPLAQRLRRLLEKAGSATEAVSPAAVRPLAAAPEIPGYCDLEVIGVGGMGVVYRAKQMSPRRTVAIKLVHGSGDSATMEQRFVHEAELLARLQHPGIATIYETGTIESRPYFVMEHIAGMSIVDYVTEHDLSTRQRLELIAQVGDAVHHAHQRGIIHRDLKPANILIDEGGRPKVLDFGIARVVESDEEETGFLTRTGQVIGTVAYMSPEQASGRSREISVTSDVYSLGVVAYEVLTGRLPIDIEEKGLAEALQLIQDQPPRSMGTSGRPYRRDVETIVRKALMKEPDRRYPSASEFSADLRRYLNDEPIQARPTSAIYQLVKFTRRNKGLAGGVGSALLALILGLVGTSMGYVAATDSEERAIARAEEADRVLELFSGIFDSVEGYGLEAKVVDALDAASKSLVETDTPQIRARILKILAHGNYILGRYELAEELSNDGLVHLEDSDPFKIRSDLQFVRTRARLACGRHAEALEEAQKLYLDRRMTLGIDHEETFRAELLIVSCLRRLGDSVRALSTIQGILDRAREVFGDEGTITHLVRFELSRLHIYRGNTAEALAMLEIIDRYVEEDSLESLSLKKSIADAHLTSGRLHEAIEMLEGVIAAQLPRLGEDHASVLSSKMSLVAAYGKVRRFADAVELQKEILEVRRAMWGNDDVRTLSSIADLGVARWENKEFDIAEALFREALAGQREKLGDDHAKTLLTLLNLAQVLKSQGNLDEAEQRLVSVIGKLTDNLGPEDIATLTAKHNLCAIYWATERIDLAEPLCREVVAAERSWVTPRAEHYLARIHWKRGKTQEAEELLLAMIERARAEYGPVHRNVQSPQSLLSMVYFDAGRFSDAADVDLEIYEIVREANGPEHPATIREMVAVLGSLQILERYEESEELSRELLRIRKRALDESSAVGIPSVEVRHDYIEILHFLGKILSSRERHDEAVEIFEQTVSEIATCGTAIELVRYRLDRSHTFRLMSRHADAESELLAVHVLLKDSPDRALSKRCREELVILYTELGRTEDAARFQRVLKTSGAEN